MLKKERLMDRTRRQLALLGGVGVAALLAQSQKAVADQPFTGFAYPGGLPGAPTGAGGTSPTSRTTPARVGDLVNVKEFGATGDGTTDDTAAIQAAVNWNSATNSARGGIFFPPGVYKVTAPGINLTWVNGTGGGQASFIIRGVGDASKINGTISGGYVFYRNNTTYSNYSGGGPLVIEKMTITNGSATAGSGLIFIASNVTLRISDIRGSAQNGIVLQNGVSQDWSGVVTSVSAPRTINFSGGISPNGVNSTSNFYAYDTTDSSALAVASKVTGTTGTSPVTQVVLNKDFTGANPQVGDTIKFGSVGLFVFTATIFNCALVGFGKASNGGTANGDGIAMCQGCTVISCDITGFNVGIRCYATANLIQGGRLEVSTTGILTGVDQQGITNGGNAAVNIVGPSFESNDTAIDMTSGTGDATIQGAFVTVGGDGHGVDGIVFSASTGKAITVSGTAVTFGGTGYGIRCPWSGATPSYRTFIGVTVKNSTDEAKCWEMPVTAWGARWINCSSTPDPKFTIANFPGAIDSNTNLLTTNIGDEYVCSDSPTAATGNFMTAVSAKGGSNVVKLRATATAKCTTGTIDNGAGGSGDTFTVGGTTTGTFVVGMILSGASINQPGTTEPVVLGTLLSGAGGAGSTFQCITLAGGAVSKNVAASVMGAITWSIV